MLAYLNYIKGILPDTWTYTEDLNINWNGEDTICILKSQTGSVYEDSRVIPIQLLFLTPDVVEIRTILEAFCSTYHNTYFTLGLDVAKQVYFSPITPTVANATGNTFTNQVILTGTITISNNVSDIKEVWIDGTKYPTVTRDINYTANVDTIGLVSFTTAPPHAKAIAIDGIVQLSITMINKNNAFCNKLRNIRKGTVSTYSTFTIKLVTSDNDAYEEYTMICSSYAINSENQSLPVVTATFIEASGV